MSLPMLGANARVLDLFSSQATDGQLLGRVTFSSHEQYGVWLEEGEREAVVAGRLRYEEELPVVGDWVCVRPIDATMALIEGVLPRQGELRRRAAGSDTAAQPMVANVDVALLVCTLDAGWNPRRLERYLVLAQASRVEAVVVLNKKDQCADLQGVLEEVNGIAKGVPVVALEARHSVEELRPYVKGQTVVLLGSSGAGKSTITNGLLGTANQTTNAVREADAKGRHTTTSRMLLPLPEGSAESIPRVCGSWFDS